MGMAGRNSTDEFSEDFIEKPVAPASERRGFGPDSLANSLAGVVRRFAPRHGFVGVDIIADWESIAGPELARMFSPVKIGFPFGKRSGGTLYIELKNASQIATVQYEFPKIIDRVNTHFGYNAIASVRRSVRRK
jgi:hypothetical protein